MALRSARRIHRITDRVIATAVALSLLSTPVTYRGGADVAHAHTIFQLWEDVRIGSFTHHAPDDEADRTHLEVSGDGHGTVGHAAMGDGDHVAGSMAADHDVATEQVGRESQEPVRGSPTGTSTGAVELDQDAPVASSAFAPSVQGTILALPSAPALLVSESLRVRTAVRLDGMTDSPTPPPPRQAA